MLTCPHCHHEIQINELPHPGFFKNFRVCPDCNGSFTPDTNTKYLQAVCILISIISLVITLLLYFKGTQWLIPAILSYAGFGLIVYLGNKRIYLVPYQKDQNANENN